jgi:hypothetical protein
MLFDYIDVKIFLISLTIGLFFVYITGVKPKVIYIYPTPDNEDKILYKDNADNCFKYNSTEVTCPKDESKIQKIPGQ